MRLTTGEMQIYIMSGDFGLFVAYPSLVVWIEVNSLKKEGKRKLVFVFGNLIGYNLKYLKIFVQCKCTSTLSYKPTSLAGKII